MPVEDAATTRRIRCEITKRTFDSTRLNVHVMHGVVHIEGRMKTLRSYPDVDLTQEKDVLTRIIRQCPGIRDVIWDVAIVN